MYDPLVHDFPSSQQPHVRSYWQAHTAVNFPNAATALPERADIVVIGAGYTGLNAALELAKHYQQNVVLVDANQLGWGCSTRNAGFAMPGTGRLSLADWQKRCGTATAQAIYNEYQAAFARLEAHLQACPQQLEVQRGGYLKIAHRLQAVPALQRSLEQLQQFEPDARWLDSSQTQQRVNTPQAYGAIHYPNSFGLNPLLLTASLARQCQQAGVTLVERAAVMHWERHEQRHRLHTSKGKITAAKVVVATNGYTSNQLHPSLQGRTLPVLSSVIVTRPLTSDERRSIGLQGNELVMDTRVLKYYYRLLPDGRLLFGGRGAIRGKDAQHPRYARHLLEALAGTFPSLQALAKTPVDYYWSGWISVALDNYPRIYSPADSIYTSMGYCGSGLTFSQLAGQRLAQLTMGETLPELPFYQSPLAKFPLPSLRRLGQWGFYQLARWRRL